MWITENDDIYHFTDFESDSNLFKIKNHAEIFFKTTEAELVVPLILNKSLLGMIVLGKRKNGKKYSKQEIVKLKTGYQKNEI
ncbi:hypothetical protein EHQ12_13260 [Leptospira gomenensis]|nr:hypothetical protein EHQ12_13260 [Leptospira gomenensis]